MFVNTHSVESIMLKMEARGLLGQGSSGDVKILIQKKQHPFEFRRQEKTYNLLLLV